MKVPIPNHDGLKCFLTVLVAWFANSGEMTWASNPPQGRASNSGAIGITDNSTATPYPSRIMVPVGFGTLSNLRVNLLGFSHTYPADTRLLLVSPTGKSCLLMSSAGGGLPGASNLNISFTDSAESNLPTPLENGFYRPTANFQQSLSFPAPAPSAPYGTQLSVFNGEPCAGAWSLYALDGIGGYDGTITGGWNLEINLGGPIPLPELFNLDPLEINAVSATLRTEIKTYEESTDVFLEYGTNGIDFPNKLNLDQGISDSFNVEVEGIPFNLMPLTTYYYRFSATNGSGTTYGDIRSFTTIQAVSSFSQIFPQSPFLPLGFNTTINLSPLGVGGWRYLGETSWRGSGVPTGANRSGSHLIEFRPVSGYTQPPSEFLPEAIQNTTLTRNYAVAPVTENGSLAVILKPDNIAAASVQVANRAQWRLLGENDTQWRNSGAAIAGLVPGTHLIEFKSIPGRVTPDPLAVASTEDNAYSLTVTYFSPDTSVGTAPQPVPFATVANDPTIPYAFVGQVRWDGGSGSGFALNARVIATAAQNVFNDATLSAHIGVQFLFRRDSVGYEPVPQNPRASFILDDYASKRVSENSPGTFSPTSLNANVAAIYYDNDIDPAFDMASGYLASDNLSNPFLLSSARKTLAGYPVDGGVTANRGRMHATPATNVNFSLLSGYTYSTPSIRGGYGFAGAPLFVEHDFGGGSTTFFPAAIHIGSHNGQTAVRAIDSRVIELFTWANRDTNGGSGPPTPGATLVSLSGNLNTAEKGFLKVILEPAAARTAGASWSIDPEATLRQSDTQKSLTAGNYTVKLKTIPGYVPPPDQATPVQGGITTTITYPYQALTPLILWRFANFGTYDNIGDAADGNDFDKDGETNIKEFTAGTNPKNANDVFRIANPTKSGNTFTATVAGKAGRSYKLQRNTTLSGTWTTVATRTTLASDQGITLTDPTAPTGKAFYQAEVNLP